MKLNDTGEEDLITRLRDGDDLHSRIEAADEIERLQDALRWAIGNLDRIVTDDRGDGAFVRQSIGGMELVGFGPKLNEVRAFLRGH
jgi:hypothetical protein